MIEELEVDFNLDGVNFCLVETNGHLLVMSIEGCEVNVEMVRILDEYGDAPYVRPRSKFDTPELAKEAFDHFVNDYYIESLTGNISLLIPNRYRSGFFRDRHNDR